MESAHRFVDHTADLALEVQGPTQEALLLEAARAITGALTEQAAIEPAHTRSVHIEALDPEDRLVCWLNEVIVLAIVDGFLLADADITLSGTGLTAELRGEASASHRIRSELKSATYHDLRIEPVDGGWQAFIVIDV